MSNLQPIPLSSLRKIGLGILRPEDVAVGPDGRVWASDANCACAEILPDGSLRRVGQLPVGCGNGINFDRQGRIVIANFEGGPLHRFDPNTGAVETLATEVEGRKLTTSNYPVIDRAGNIWCSNSTDASPWQAALDGRRDGFVFRIRPDGRADIVARDLQFANGLALDAEQSHLFVCQTTGCNVLRFPIRADATLGPPEPYGPTLGDPFDPMNPPADMSTTGLTDGCGFDVEGNLWVTLVMANKVVAITPAGKVVTVIEDPDNSLMLQPTNIAWGGADGRDLYVGSITNEYVLCGRSPVGGLVPNV